MPRCSATTPKRSSTPVCHTSVTPTCDKTRSNARHQPACYNGARPCVVGPQRSTASSHKNDCRAARCDKQGAGCGSSPSLIQTRWRSPRMAGSHPHTQRSERSALSTRRQCPTHAKQTHADLRCSVSRCGKDVASMQAIIATSAAC